MTSLDPRKPIVLDCGSKKTKVGFAGDRSPISIFESAIGYPRHHNMFPPGLNRREFYSGEKCVRLRGALCLKYPIKRGIVSDWDSMEKFLHHTLHNDLSVEPGLHPLIVNDAPFNSKSNRERMTQIMFETFGVPAFYAIADPVASLFASGHTTGIVIKSGKDVSYTSPIYEGHVLPHAISTLEFGGDDLTYFMGCKIGREEPVVPNWCKYVEIMEDVKKKLSYVALDFERELKVAKENPSSIEAEYEFPNGEILALHSPRVCCAEPLFRPSLFGEPKIENFGIHELANNSIMKCPSNIRQTLYKNIFLSGGSTMFPGFGQRLTREMNYLTPDDVEVKVDELENREHSSWMGESIFASLNTFPQMCISNGEYYEYGPTIFQRKCL